MASNKSPATQAPPGSVDISTLPLPQLSQLKSQLDTELTHLTTSFQKLRAAQQKFRDCIRSIQLSTASAPSSQEEKSILVPLTTSLYVPGRLASTDNVLVDVGTGFYVEKNTSEAVKFYEGKIEELGGTLKELEGIVQGKSGSLRVVEDVMRGKVLAQQGQGGGAGAKG